MWHANDKKSVGRSSPADYEGKRCSAVSYSTGKLGKYGEKAVARFGKKAVEIIAIVIALTLFYFCV